MAENPVRWFEIYVQDMARARAFYEAVLARPLQPLPMPEGIDGMEMFAFAMNEGAAGAGGALVHMPGMTPGVGGTLVYFGCEDCAAEIARVATAGGRVLQEKTSLGEYGFMALASDTEGNTFGLHSTR